MLAALGLTGAAAATLSVLPRQSADQTAAEQTAPRPAPEKGGGYALTEHVKRYYQTTLI
jgi:hypothetical protein